MKLQTVIMCSLAAATLAGIGDAQTRVDLRTQGKSVDFSSANSTLPSKTGAQLPAACQAGETFVKTDAPPGRNWYVCTSANLWTVQGIELPPQAGNAGAVLSTDGAAQLWKPLGGDISGHPESALVNRILGRALNPTAPATGQVLAWDGEQWSPWTVIGVSSVFGRTGAIASQTGDYAFPQIGGTILGAQLPAAGGDLSGGLTAATVTRIQGQPIGLTLPALGQVLSWDGAKWAPSSVTATAGVSTVFGRSGLVTAQTGDYSFPQIGGTILGGQLPAAGGDLSGSLTAAAVTRIQGQPVGSTAPASGQVLSWDGAKWAASTLTTGISSVFGRSGAITAQAGDYTAAQVANAVDKTSPNAFSAGARQTFLGSTASSGIQIAPSPLPGAAQTGDLMLDAGDSNRLKLYDGVSWVTLSPNSSKSNYSASFFDQITVTIPGATHQLGTANLIVECYDSATPANRVEPSSITVNPNSYDVVIVFGQSRSGRCVINGYTGGAVPGGGSVGSVFGRTGDVVAVNGDYQFSQIAGAVADSQIAGGVNASKIGAGTVTNQAFGYLGNATSDLQTQLNGKAGLSHSHTLNGDVTGDTGSASVVALQNRPVANIAPSDGQALIWSAAANQWAPGTVSGSGGGGGGASMASQLGDFTVTRTSGTVLSIGTNCSATTPCNVRFGNQVYALTSSATATLASGSGTAYVYADSAGNLTVQTALSLSCSGACVTTSSGTGFPMNSIPLYTWSATTGVWDPGGGIDRRGWLGSTNLLAGAGIMTVQSGGQTTIAVDTAVVPTYLTGSATLDFPSIPAGACSADLTFALPGANVGNGVLPGWPSGLEAGLSGLMRVSAPGIVAVRLCADSTKAVDPASANFTATIVRGY